MSSARSRTLRDSLGDSWGNAEYESDSGASIRTASDLDPDAGSESDIEDNVEPAVDGNEQRDIATPLPSRVTRASSNTPQEGTQKTKAPSNRVAQRHMKSSRSSPMPPPSSKRSTPGSRSLEPSFIMPSMHGSTESGYNGSPLRNSQVRARKVRQPQPSQAGSTYSTSRNANRRTPRQTSSAPVDEPEANRGPGYYLNLFWQHALWPTLRYVFNVGAITLGYLKPIFAIGLTAFLLMSLYTTATGFARSSLQRALSPICVIPGSSFIMPFCANMQYDESEPAFDELVRIQSTFEDIVRENQDASMLPQSMKQSEAAIRDIKTLVMYSKLPSKNLLEVEFESFIATAKEASSDLIRYNHKIGATVDKVISTNRWTMQILQGLSEKDASIGKAGRVKSALNPLSVFMAPSPTLHQQVFEQYLKHVSANKEEITILINMGIALLSILNNLEERLDTINQIVVRDNIKVSQNNDELLAQLWTKLGGNSATRKDHYRQLQLLKQVTGYREQAVNHVAVTLVKLQEIATALDDLRDNVAAPEVLGFRDEMPIQHYLELVDKSTERLQDVRGEARRRERLAYRDTMKGVRENVHELPARTEEPPIIHAKVKEGWRN